MKFTIAFITSLVLLTVAAFFAPRFVPQDKAKIWAEKELSSALDTRAVIGSMHFYLLPYPGYKIERLELYSKVPAFSAEPFLKANKIEGTISIAALVNGIISMDVDVYGANVKCIFAKGASNLPGIFKPSENGRANPPSMPLPVPSGGLHVPNDVPVENLPPANEGNVSGSVMHALEGSAFASDGATMPHRSSFSLKIKSMHAYNASLDIITDGRKIFSASGMRIALGGISARAVEGGKDAFETRFRTAFSFNAANALIKLDAAGNLSYDASTTSLKLSGATAYIAGTKLDVNGEATFAGGVPRFSVKVLSESLPAQLIARILSMANIGQHALKGAMLLSAAAEGTTGNLSIILNADATNLSFSWRGGTKPAGVPLKVSADLAYKGETLLLKSANMGIADAALHLSGSLPYGGKKFRLKIHVDKAGDAAIRIILPKFGMLGAFAGMSGDAVVSSENNISIQGDFDLGNTEIAGIPAENIKLAFSADTGGLKFSSVKAKVCGGALSANGGVDMGETVKYSMEGIVKGMKVSCLGILKGMMTGSADVVFNAASEGADPVTVADALKLSGTVMISDGSWKADLFPNVLSGYTWKSVASLLDAEIDEGGVSSVSEKAGRTFSNFRASFSTDLNSASFEDAKWLTAVYRAHDFKGKIAGSGDNAGKVQGSICDAHIGRFEQ